MIAIMIEDVFSVVPGARTRGYSAGAAIFRQGAPTRAIFKVQNGCVEVVRHLSDGSFVTIATARAGDTFAEAALFTERYHCDAVARTDCEIVSAPTSAVRELIDREPKQARQLAAFFAGQVRDLRTRIEILRIKRAPDRLLAWLRCRAKGDPLTLKVTSSWASVAGEIALTPEAIYRALRTLERRGEIARRGAELVLRAR